MCIRDSPYSVLSYVIILFLCPNVNLMGEYDTSLERARLKDLKGTKKCIPNDPWTLIHVIKICFSKHFKRTQFLKKSNVNKFRNFESYVIRTRILWGVQW